MTDWRSADKAGGRYRQGVTYNRSAANGSHGFQSAEGFVAFVVLLVVAQIAYEDVLVSPEATGAAGPMFANSLTYRWAPRWCYFSLASTLLGWTILISESLR